MSDNRYLSHTAVYALWQSGAAFAVMVFVAFFMDSYNALPDEVPIHFGLGGEADAYGNKGTVWVLLILALGIYMMMMVLVQFPASFNYPVKVQASNRSFQHQNAQEMLAAVNFWCALLFLQLYFMVWSAVQDIPENLLTKVWIPLLLMCATIGWYLRKSLINR